ncbi:MAG: iron ABC transporter permease [Clostridia bacterium]|nr:iron ABC transporter permease [Clostridia bacterium]
MKKEPFFKGAAGALALAAFTLVLALLSLRMGSANLSSSAFFSGLFGRAGFETETLIIRGVRLPRVLGAMLAGAGLSVSGLLLQNIMGNALAGPNVIGVNAGAGFFTILILYFLEAYYMYSPAAAFLGAFLTTLFIVLLAKRVNAAKNSIVLAGVAVTALLNAGISMISLLDADVLSQYNAFSIGGLSSIKTEALLFPAIMILAGCVISFVFSRQIDAMALGDGVAQSLGVNVRGVRFLLIAVSSACAGAVVSFAGLMGFVGLIVPHIARRLTGAETRGALISSVFVGSSIVLLADLAGRLIFAPSEIPAGLVMAFIGVPFFFYLLFRRESAC